MRNFIKEYFDKKREAKEREIESQRKAQEELIRKAKEEYRAKKEKIDTYVNDLKSKRYEAFDKEFNECIKYNEIHNSTCPKCKGHEVHQEYRKIKGEAHGSTSITGTFARNYGHIYGNGHIDGNIDTFLVNKCDKCGQEWEFESTIPDFDWFPRNLLTRFYCRIFKILDTEYNPCDIKEEYNSYEEKRNHEIEKFKRDFSDSDDEKLMLNLPIEILWYFTIEYSWEISDCRLKEICKKQSSFNEDEYIEDFSDEVKNLLIELGFKRIYEDGADNIIS